MSKHGERRSRIAAFKQPFLVGLLGGATLLPGCGASVEDGPNGSSTQSISDDCPGETPEVSTSCGAFAVGDACGEKDGCGNFQGVECGSDGTWSYLPASSCNPPGPDGREVLIGECPDESPMSGSDCAAFPAGLRCGEEDSCSGIAELECGESGVWEELPLPTCNPPAPLIFECPDDVPAEGTSCGEYERGLGCGIDDCTGAPLVVCDEEEDAWITVNTSCNPPEPQIDTCPEETPEIGTSCGAYELDLECGVDDCTGEPLVVCDGDGLWVNGVNVSCNPPAQILLDAGAAVTGSVDGGGAPVNRADSDAGGVSKNQASIDGGASATDPVADGGAPASGEDAGSAGN